MADRDSVEFMIGNPEDDLAPLETARQVLETRLAQHEDWRALQQLESREASGEPIVAVESSRLRATLVAALEHNRAFRAHRALHTAILALRGEDEHIPPIADKNLNSSAQATDAQHEQPTCQLSPGNQLAKPATNGHAANGATSVKARSHSTNSESRRGNSVPTLTLKIATATPTPAKLAAPPATAPTTPANPHSDDLTRIWNIDKGLARRLHDHGILTWQPDRGLAGRGRKDRLICALAGSPNPTGRLD